MAELVSCHGALQTSGEKPVGQLVTRAATDFTASPPLACKERRNGKGDWFGDLRQALVIRARPAFARCARFQPADGYFPLAAAVLVMNAATESCNVFSEASCA
jgi:hypothetical protein